MTATNHALTGAVIGLAVGQPWLAIPLAFGSHFVLDALPHFGSQRFKPSHRLFIYFLAVDVGLCASIVLVLANLQPVNWLLASVCALVAISADLMWVKLFIWSQNGKEVPKPKNVIVKFHSWIQWYEREPGIFFELLWGAAMVVAIAKVAII